MKAKIVLMALLACIPLMVGWTGNQGGSGVAPGTYLPITGGSLLGPVDHGLYAVTNVPTPTNFTDASNKGYVDAHSGIVGATGATGATGPSGGPIGPTGATGSNGAAGA